MLVTGAAGFIGSHLVETLLDLGFSVLGLDNRLPATGGDDAVRRAVPNLSTAVNHPDFTAVPADITTANLVDAVTGCKTVYHLAAIPGVRDSWGAEFQRYVDVNVLGTQRLMDACLRAGVRRVVYASSSSVYGSTGRPSRETDRADPLSPYGVTKLAGEQLCLAYAARPESPTAVSSVRYFTVYGPRQRSDMAIGRIIEAALTGSAFTLYGDGSQRREFTHVSDVVEATIAASSVEGRAAVFNVGGGSSVTVAEVLELAGRVVGRAVPITRVEQQPGDVPVTEADLSHARKLLGFEPRVDLADGMRGHAAWMRGVLAAAAGVPALQA